VLLPVGTSKGIHPTRGRPGAGSLAASGARRVPVTMIAAQLGHSRNSMTLETYWHVLLDEF
jgi:integrase